MNTILFLQAIFTMFISGGLFFKSSGLKSTTIALFTTLFSIEIFYFLYGTTGIANIFQAHYGRYFFTIGLLYGPFLFLHFQAVIGKKKKLLLKDILHFIPALVINIYMWDIITLPDEDRVRFFNDPETFYSIIIALNYVRCLHLIIYSILLVWLFLKNKKTLPDNQILYLGGLSLIYFIVTIVLSMLTLFASGWRDFAWYYIICNCIILSIAYLLYTDPAFLQKLKEKYSASHIPAIDQEKIKQYLKYRFKNEQIFLDSQLSIDTLAKMIKTSPQYLSQTFSQTLNESFNDFVNRHRVTLAKKKLKDPAFDHFKIEAIANECGFKNKSTFYKAFSKFVGTTPAAFRKH